jgi:hypothetical protein
VPNRDTELLPGDEVLAVLDPELEAELTLYLGGTDDLGSAA